MASIFTKIISGEIPSHKIAETEHFLAFLDVFPLVNGHTLVIPKLEVDSIFDLEDGMLGNLHIFSKKVAHAVKKAIPCRRIGVAVIGLEVPHAHIHLVPLTVMNDINFTNPKLKPSVEDLERTAILIRQFL